MKKIVCVATALAALMTAAADRDAMLRAAQDLEKDGKAAEAAKAYAAVEGDADAPKHQRLAALCGLFRTDAASLTARGEAALAHPDAEWSGTAAQALALLPSEQVAGACDAWLRKLPDAAFLKLLNALVHVKNPAARRLIAETLAEKKAPAVRAAALEGLGRMGDGSDANTLLTWLKDGDAELAAAARRGLILLGDVKTDAAVVARLKSAEGDAALLVKLLDVITVRNALGHADKLVPYLTHADDKVRLQTFKAIGQQGLYSEQAAVLAAAAKAKDGRERQEARRAVMKIARRAGGVQFKAKRIGNCRTEACGVADFNQDGKPDVVAGPFLYLAPEFKPVRIREVETDVKEDGKGYARDFMNLPLDVDADGRLDVVSGDWFSRETWWFRNSLPLADLWPKTVIEQTGNIETGILVDIDGDGRATDFFPDTKHTCVYQLGRGGTLGGHFARRTASAEPCDMGRGCGDVNGDGLNDLLTPDSWHEQTKDGEWKKHAWDIGFSDTKRALGHASNIIVYDVNRDGLNDIIVSSAHKYGIFWCEQLRERDAAGDIRFRRHVIDDTWTQAHYLGWGDIDGDGVPEIVTGKRFMAHNGNDPDEYGRLCIFYYDFTPGANPEFRKYVISYDADVSVGLNVDCVDMDGDGDLDLVTTGKWGGPAILENKTREPTAAATRPTPQPLNRTEIVVEKGAPKTVEYAAAELADVLGETLGYRPEIVPAPRAGFAAIVLGDGALARAAGLDVKRLRRDAFEIREKDGRVYVAGRDDASADPAKIVAEGGVGRLEFERGTLFGVYEFLELFAGTRFYFPGELGTVIQKRSHLAVPAGFALVRAPAFTVRNLNVTGDGAVPGETNSIPWNPTAYGGEVTPETRRFRGVWKAKNWLRLRFQTESIPCCHGQRGLDYARRFHATHPEYFALSRKRADGGWDRDVSDDIYEECGTHLCHSSAVWEEFYQDAKAYFSGASAETRGIRRRHGKEFAWGPNCKGGRFFDVMPQDGLSACHCEKCQKAYEGQTGGQYATELIWTRTADLARRIGAEFPNAVVTQMAYWPYRNVPKCELPPNLWVMVAEYGPWAYVNQEAFRRDVAELKAWYEKLGHKVWMWTYPSKFGRKACPGIPDMAPRTWAKTYRAYAPYSMGAFCEVECDNTLYHYLNYYVYSKLAWDPQMDEEALLDEHFRLMFGAAAPEMAAFYADLERKWTHEVLHIGGSDRSGTRVHVAGEEALYGAIYSPEVCAGWARLFDRAGAKLEKGSLAARRLAFVREQFLAKIEKAAADFARATDVAVPHPHDAAKNMLVDAAKAHEIVVTPDQKAEGGRSLPQTGYQLKFARNFEADTEYALSYCFELDAQNPWGTFFTQYSTGPGQWFNVQKGGLAGGKVKPSYREYVFRTPKKMGPKERHSFGFYLTGVGRAKVWNVHLEKRTPNASVSAPPVAPTK